MYTLETLNSDLLAQLKQALNPLSLPVSQSLGPLKLMSSHLPPVLEGELFSSLILGILSILSTTQPSWQAWKFQVHAQDNDPVNAP